ncbi:1438_t:CDS:2 [Gigaspora margarita]|uniref:1438_t:CDS:1 n=1 Tax=Gigaspora margarita TaxID=4874 RepID=A0ABN7VQA1_GIGMA|nr:1438_t:CDS:2 [Gigaspora margarita]
MKELLMNFGEIDYMIVNNQQNQLIALPVGFVQLEFHGGDEDHEDFVDRFISYITLARVNNDANILTILDQSLKGEAREWYHREFDNKNLELQNILDNSGIGATIAHIRGANAAAITGAVASFPNVPLGLSAGGRPTNAVPVAPNAGGGVPIILAGMRSGQKLWWMKKHYPTANKYVKILEIRALKQGIYESIPSFWAKIQKYGDQLGYTSAQKKTHFLSGVRPDIRDEIYRIVATVENFQPPPKIYPIKSEKPQQAFYIVDQEGNYMDPLAQDPNYHKYLEQAKALLKKPQQQNQNARMDRIESKIDEIGQMTSQFRRMILDNQSKKPVAKSNSTY